MPPRGVPYITGRALKEIIEKIGLLFKNSGYYKKKIT
jgi:predicted nucleic acid-binding Zn ribbon protein